MAERAGGYAVGLAVVSAGFLALGIHNLVVREDGTGWWYLLIATGMAFHAIRASKASGKTTGRERDEHSDPS